jgi:hypothetical protein
LGTPLVKFVGVHASTPSLLERFYKLGDSFKVLLQQTRAAIAALSEAYLGCFEPYLRMIVDNASCF